MGRLASGDFFKDVHRLLGWGWGKGKERVQKRKKGKGLLHWLEQQMKREV